ncbi:hypothetical protein [Jiella marina]|uniref:hypothetical protein n=1 Tax=Jiella sp. LLJ827 TaxID=2917712 RepID=UPI0021013454|nr:hypothetical protein [Jiella sp. LLJ827]MCQ0987840.1 hypothetical protein [Jiella sp. LLJ827]
MKRSLMALAATGLLAWPTLGAAQTMPSSTPEEADSLPGRFAIVSLEGQIARLDTATGRIEPCRVRRDEIRCGAATAAAPQGENRRLRRLERRVAALERAVAELRRARPRGEDADIAIEQMQKLFKGFADIVKELDGEERRDNRRELQPNPDRT